MPSRRKAGPSGHVMSARKAFNFEIMEDITRLYLPNGGTILDMTYGKGLFWGKRCPPIQAVLPPNTQVWGNDIDPEAPCEFHYDFRCTEFPDQFFDMVVLDPPYSVKDSKNDTRGKNTGAGTCREVNGDKFHYGIKQFRQTHEDNVIMYKIGALEAHRVLVDRGLLVIKIKDEGELFKHVPLMAIDNFVCEDLFILIQHGEPAWGHNWVTQRHARKNHSYFIVQRKLSDAKNGNHQ